MLGAEVAGGGRGETGSLEPLGARHGAGGPSVPTADAGQVHDVAVVELDGLSGEVERQE